jgi:hypothetical protein
MQALLDWSNKSHTLRYNPSPLPHGIAWIVPPTLQTSEHMFMSFAKHTVPDLPANKNRFPKLLLLP